MANEVSQGALDELRDRFETSSWALWSEGFPAETSPESQVADGSNPSALVQYIQANRKHLRADVVLMGTRPSAHLEGDFRNFHSPDTRYHSDYHLKREIQEADLEHFVGAYMTDLIKEVIGPEEDLRPPSPRDVRSLEAELELLDEPSYDIICFGKEDFEYLLGELFGSLGAVDTPEGVPDILSIETDLAGRDVQFYVVYSYAQGHHQTMGEQLRVLDNQLG